jgi:Membrane transporters of cations and cationic drugs
VNGYLALALAIVGEVFGTSMLKLSDGFSHAVFSLLFLLGFGFAFYFLSLCMKTVPLGTAYAIWSGVGTVLTTVIGVLAWGEPLNFVLVLGIVLIVGGVALLNSGRTAEG